MVSISRQRVECVSRNTVCSGIPTPYFLSLVDMHERYLISYQRLSKINLAFKNDKVADFRDERKHSFRNLKEMLFKMPSI